MKDFVEDAVDKHSNGETLGGEEFGKPSVDVVGSLEGYFVNIEAESGGADTVGVTNTWDQAIYQLSFCSSVIITETRFIDTVLDSVVSLLENETEFPVDSSRVHSFFRDEEESVLKGTVLETRDLESNDFEVDVCEESDEVLGIIQVDPGTSLRTVEEIETSVRQRYPSCDYLFTGNTRNDIDEPRVTVFVKPMPGER